MRIGDVVFGSVGGVGGGGGVCVRECVRACVRGGREARGLIYFVYKRVKAGKKRDSWKKSESEREGVCERERDKWWCEATHLFADLSGCD